MMLLRAAVKKDCDALLKLAKKSSIGVTTLPANKQTLLKKLSVSQHAFSGKTNPKNNNLFYFVLEDVKKKKIVGVSAVESILGMETPFYSYKLSKIVRVSNELKVRKEYQVLQLVNDYIGATEVCSLYLSPEYRRNGYGRFLSRTRFLFMAQHRKYFSNTVIAEMRGVSDKNGSSPFWKSLGALFFDIDFAKADYLTGVSNKQFIADLMPRHAIYVELLSKQAKRVIGEPHNSTKSALHILEREGFCYRNYIDIFDGGPTIEAQFAEIKTIRESKLLKVTDIAKVSSVNKVMVSNTQLNFRCQLSEIDYLSDKTCRINSDNAKALKIKKGDKVRVCDF